MKINNFAAVGILCLSSLAYAGPVARVTQSVPIYEQEQVVNNVCVNETITNTTPSAGATILGGIIGGAIGAQYDSVFTVLGTLVGASMGAGASKGTQVQQRCYPEAKTQTKIVGYNVTYVYNKQTYVQRLNYDPGVGATIQLGVPDILR